MEIEPLVLFVGLMDGVSKALEWESSAQRMVECRADGQIFYRLPKSCKLYYVFDFGDDWTFEIRKLRREPSVIRERKYPFLIGIEGEIPEQYPNMDD